MDRNFQKSYIISAAVFDKMNSCRCKRDFKNEKTEKIEKTENLKIPNVSYISSNNVSNNPSYSGNNFPGVNKGCGGCCKKDVRGDGGDRGDRGDEGDCGRIVGPAEAYVEVSRPMEADNKVFNKDSKNIVEQEDIDMKSENEESLNKEDSKTLIGKTYRSPIVVVKRVKNVKRKKKVASKRGSPSEEDNKKDSNVMQVNEKEYKEEEGRWKNEEEEDEMMIIDRDNIKRKRNEYESDESDESYERERVKRGNKADYDLDNDDDDEKNVKKKKKKKKKILWKKKYNRMMKQQALYNSIMDGRNSDMKKEKEGEDDNISDIGDIGDIGDNVIEIDNTRNGGGKWKKKKNVKYNKKMQKALYNDINDNRNYKEMERERERERETLPTSATLHSGESSMFLKNKEQKRSESEIDSVKNDDNKEVKVRRGIFKPSPLEIDEGDIYIPKKKNIKRKSGAALLVKPRSVRKKIKYDQGTKRKKLEEHIKNKKQKKGWSDIKYNVKFDTWRL